MTKKPRNLHAPAFIAANISGQITSGLTTLEVTAMEILKGLVQPISYSEDQRRQLARAAVKQALALFAELDEMNDSVIERPTSDMADPANIKWAKPQQNVET